MQIIMQASETKSKTVVLNDPIQLWLGLSLNQDVDFTQNVQKVTFIVKLEQHAIRTKKTII